MQYTYIEAGTVVYRYRIYPASIVNKRSID
jgi:hypothetical protein